MEKRNQIIEIIRKETEIDSINQFLEKDEPIEIKQAIKTINSLKRSFI